MSAIAGIVGDIEDRARRVTAMVANQSDRGPDSTGALHVDAASLGHAALHASPESVSEAQPLCHAETGCIITADIRLDNRESLLAELRFSNRDAGDAELALAAYLKWGLDFPTRLLGDFALGVWDPRGGQLVLVRDHLSVRPLHYAVSRDRLIFASTVEAVLTASDTRHPVYLDKLQHFLVEPLEAAELDKSLFEGIHALPAASVMTWSPGGRPRITRYWELQEPARLVLPSDQDYVEAFGDVVGEVVGCRLRAIGPVSAELSGGLDSTAIVAVAAARLAPEALHVYSGLEVNPYEFSDTPHIQAVATHLQLEPRCFSDQDIAATYDLDAILEAPSSLFDTSEGLRIHFSREVKRSGSRVLLTGLGPDTALTVDSRRAARETLAAGHVIGALQELRYSEGARVRPTRVARQLIAPMVPAALRTRMRTARRRSRFRLDLRSAGIDPAWPSAARLMQANEALWTDPRWATPSPRLNKLRHPFGPTALERYDRTTARFGVECRNPFMDRRFLEFCLSLPSTQLRRSGWSKWILREFLASRVPPSVALRAKSSGAMAPFMQAVAQCQAEQRGQSPTPLHVEGMIGPCPAEADTWARFQRDVVARFVQVHAESRHEH